MSVEFDRDTVEKIKNRYENKPKVMSDFEELKALDKKVKNPPMIVAYIVGIIGILIFGVGMCFGLDVFGSNCLIWGIVVGVVGIAVMILNFVLYKKVLHNRKEKYAEQIISKSNDLLNA
ncbi:MAG: dihydropteridine reductase [Clostridia bacterium]|nr:dihydropteridine reductase [Clostridia bacterium]